MAKFDPQFGILLTEDEKEMFKEIEVELHKPAGKRSIPEMAKYFLNCGNI